MFALHPRPELDQSCPVCPDRPALEVLGFQIPCLFTLIETRCPQCRREFLVQRPRSWGLHDWTMLEPATGEVYSSLPGGWLERMLAWGWQSKHDRPVAIETVTRRPVRRPLIVNCLEYFYGHCLGRLFDVPKVVERHPDRDVIVIVQRSLAWLVAEGVAELWIVDIPLGLGHAFSPALAAELKRRITQFDECGVDGTGLASKTDITKLTRIAPFDWLAEQALVTALVTFIVREDRCWLYRARRTPAPEMASQQAHVMNVLAQGLLHHIPGVDIAVIGFGQTGRFADAVLDMRVAPGQLPDEIAWTKRYARSHVVLGVHGSGMLLPAAHAAGSIEIVPLDKFINIGNAYDFIGAEYPVDSVRHHHFLPMSVTLTEVATLIGATLHFVRSAAHARQALRADPAERQRLETSHGHLRHFPEPIVIEG
ncbi:MAG: hypothetical protein ABI439_13180 [Rhodospirillales bacterium]